MHTTPVKPHFLAHGNTSIEFPREGKVGMKVAASLGLVKIAENMYECPSTKDLWRVEGSRIVRVSKADEVDNGETMKAADVNAPDVFLAKILDELEF
jgi:hypothetical protein